ncbi:hypothetical protein DFJ73DRAFT_756119 [Zopfochytrium polystomum]|nr:hypothetical protein DFJ73DRAFT_756119 [Zopfochytrium polystomum]
MDFIQPRTLLAEDVSDDEDSELSEPLQPHPSRLHPSNRPDFPEPEEHGNLREILHQRIEEFKADRQAAAAAAARRRSRWTSCLPCCCGIGEENEIAEREQLLPTTPGSSSSTVHHSPRSSRNAPLIDNAGLSIIERVFFKSAPGRPQVIMAILLRLSLPDSAPVFKPARVVDLLRIAQARHFRLSSYVDPETMIAHPLATNARDLPCSYRFVKRTADDAWKDVYEEEVNTNFDVTDVSKPLWRSAIIVPEDMMPVDGPVVDGASPLVSAQIPHLVTSTFDPDEGKGKGPVSGNGSSSSSGVSVEDRFGRDAPARPPGQRNFEIIFTFHHCLGDGLSMFAYARTFLEKADAYHMNADELHLENVPVTMEPPPILDNLFNPSIIEIVPAAIGTFLRTLAKRGKRFKGRKPDHKDEKGHGDDHLSVASQSMMGRAPSPSPSRSSDSSGLSMTGAPAASSRATTVATPASIHDDIPFEVERPLKKQAHTRVRFLWFDEAFVTSLRKKSKSEGTTIAAVLVVAALAAVRTSFASHAKYRSKPLPTHQGWVVTNSLRHMLPQSKLLSGGAKQDDEGLKLFGGYAGSVTNSSLKLVDDSDVWERCRSVRKSIASVFRASVQRMKLMNYCYRHPSLWSFIQAKTDLSKLSRSYSVEVANLGAWDEPAAGPAAPRDDPRLRLEHFGGVVNSSFDGVRGLFTLGVITLGGRMSVAVGYDAASVHEEDAELFVASFCKGLWRLREAQGKVTVADIRRL